MTADPNDQTHFTRAVARMAERRRVVAHAAIHNQQGLKVIEKGVAVDAQLYDRLAHHRLQTPLADCLAVEDPVHPAGVRDAARVLAATEPLMDALFKTPRVGEILSEELALVPLPAPVAVQLAAMRDLYPELWQHSLRSALLAGWLVARTGGTRHDVRMLCAAGLLHDIGMLHLDPALQQPDTPFSGEQRRQLYTHPLVAVMQLERHHVYPRELLRAVLEHHETLDGAGYPRQVGGAELSAWGRVLGLVELATALMAPGRPAAVRRLSLALRMNQARYERPLLRELMSLLVRLDDGARADDPPDGTLQRLQAIEQLLLEWPAAAPPEPPLTPARAAVVPKVQALCQRVLVMLAATGATAPQLVLMGDEAEPDGDDELVLILHELRWQLRSVARQVRRLWRRGGDAFPPWVQAWLDRAERLHG